MVSRSRSSAFRTDIEGLRAIAVAAVLLYHAGVPMAEGGYVGVDVFFVISGFLITGLLVWEAEKFGTISLRRFYARRLRRLLPASILALAATSAMTLTVLPRVRWSSVAGDVMASAAYLVNWRFAVRAVDYLAEGSAASPLQHFWSLAVEEQFYLLWPLLILVSGLVFVARFSRRSVAVTLSIVTVASLTWSILLSYESPNEAYFVTTTRVWELSLGAGLALAVPILKRMRKTAAEALAWAGLAAIAIAVVTFGSETPFPSYTALLPTLGAAAVIAAGAAYPDTSGGRMLSLGPLVWIGGLSYSLYLYHWPMVVGAESLYGARLPPVFGLIVVTLSIVPAWLSYRFVENPIRHADSLVSPPRRAAVFGVALTAAGLLVGTGILGVARMSGGGGSEEASETVIGEAFKADAPRAALTDSEGSGDQPDLDRSRIHASMVPENVPEVLFPSLTRVVDDVPSVYAEGCHVRLSSPDPLSCEFGVERGAEVVLVGDSHAAQWIPTLESIALERRWHLTTFTKSACPFGSMIAQRDGEIYESCIAWNEQVLDELVRTSPDLVITSASTSNLPINADGSSPPDDVRGELYIDGLQDSVQALVDSSIPVVLIADTPRPLMNIPECISATDVVAECTNPLKDARSADFHKVVGGSVAGAAFVDLAPWICTDSECPPIVESVLVWRDSHHLTATYAALLSGPMSHLLR